MTQHINKDQHLALFELGHSNCRLVVISPDLAVATLYSLPMRGFVKGKVVDSVEFASTVRELARAAGLSALKYRAIVNIGSLHSRTVTQVVRHRSNGLYRSSDLDSIMDTLIDSVQTELDEVLDVIVTSARIDDALLDTLNFGVAGRDIFIQATLSTHPKLILADIVSGMNAGGIEVSEFRSHNFGLARAIKALRPDAENAVLIDIGHSATSGVVVTGGMIQSSFTIPAGSQHMTKDIAAGLGCEIESAEALKVSQGLQTNQETSSATHTKYIQPFIRPRVSEILRLSLKHFALYAKALDGGLLFCGKGSSLPGLSSFSTQVLGTQAPFICQLSQSSADAFVGAKIILAGATLDSSWLSTLTHARVMIAEINARRVERDSRPLSKLRPLWTWLSELSR